ncbi:hypothetical protein BCR33DRAFT_110410 [Rhizoclosmatium globosum]|uniref:Uncharacterized protein n=1 Tax=Rhizoclosmatium globosum TaxID=329046 RepID=A0A1Y2CID9_9FUNG|nr:hypothetical protein BCR33DRAFT_110410 [Rhizoclosmatium globosum]|eukprot:ORY46818.1 hypothetical protein BCR33DRAFT_110410 [Rhizoclosmatium globosum]
MQQPEIPLPTINTRSFSQTEDSRPAQRISAGAPRPSPLKPHGLKSELKSAASAFKGIFKQKKPEGVTVVAFNKMNASIPEPVKSQTPAEIKEFVFSVTPTESIPPEFNLEELSPRYKKHLSRKYTYSSVFTKPSDTIQRVYQEPDLDTFSYSEPTNPIPSVYDPEDASQYPPSEYSSDFQYPDASEFEQDDAGNLEQDQENVYVERFEGAHGLNSADTESYHTIHRLNMLPLVDDSNTASQPVVRRMSTGHLNLLETYSEIIGEISELVPGTPTCQLPVEFEVL